jgi:hypothetical protein
LVIPPSPTLASTSVPPTATSVAISLPTTETVVDDKNNGFAYSSGWQDVSKKQAYKRSYKLTTRNGASATFVFTGQSFSVVYKGGSAFGKLNVYLDNILVGTINENTASSTFQRRWDFPGQLTPGSHTLQLVFVTTDTTNHTSGSIDAVIIR